MGCQEAVIAFTINGVIIGVMVGICLGIVKSFQVEGRSMGDWIKELVPQCITIGVVIGFSYSLLNSCTGFLQAE